MKAEEHYTVRNFKNQNTTNLDTSKFWIIGLFCHKWGQII